MNKLTRQFFLVAAVSLGTACIAVSAPEDNVAHKFKPLSLIRIEIANQAYREAVRDSSGFLERYPNAPEAYFLRARAHSAVNNLSAAESDIRRAIRLNSGESEYWREACRIDEKLEDWSAACKDITRAIQLSHANEGSFDQVILARNQIRAQSYKQALDNLNKFLKAKREACAEALYWKAMALEAIKDDRNAVQNYDRAIELLRENAGDIKLLQSARERLKNLQTKMKHPSLH